MDSTFLEEMYIDITEQADLLKVKFTIGNTYRPPHSTIGHLPSFINYISRKLTLLSTGANTRLISKTSSLIHVDNMFVNKQSNMNCAAILENKISDHLVIAINTNLAIPKSKTIYITIYTNREHC